MMFITKLLKDRKGVTALEYGLIAALIAVVIIVAVGSLGNNLANAFNFISDEIGNATATTP
jgi:pilus assembly protein Flp/PilA